MQIIQIQYLTGKVTNLKAVTENGEEVTAVQELFFHSLEEAMEVADNVNAYADSHGKIDSWYCVYRELFKSKCKYRYVLHFPVKPGRLGKYGNNGELYTIHKIIAYIGEQEDKILYEGRNEEEWKKGICVLRRINCSSKVINNAYSISKITLTE